MPLFRLSRNPDFPPPELAEPDGLLAIGGDLSTARLLAAYRSGIFPWYNDETPPLWWSPDPRFVLFTAEFHLRESLRRVVRSDRFQVTFNRNFRAVMEGCRNVPRRRQSGTWISAEMIEAYTALHAAGHAQSVEVWRDGRLAGGLYGVAVGRCFCGESMFAIERDASKVGFTCLVATLRALDCPLVDCQVPTAHLATFGARAIPRAAFLELLRELSAAPAIRLPVAPDKKILSAFLEACRR